MKRRKDLFYLLLISCLILVFFTRYLSGENLFFATDEASSDLLDFYYPQRVYLADHLKQGQIPLWTPYQQNGFPFLAEAQTGIFYPPNLILFRLLPTPLAFNWSIILSSFILSFGTYFFLKTLKLDRLAAFFGSLVITFSGFFITHLKHVPLIQAAAFLPWAFLFIEKLISLSQKKYAIFLALALSFSILAGHLPTAYSVILFSLFYFILRLNLEFKSHSETARPIVLFLFSLLLAILLSAIQLFPTAEMFPYSSRNVQSLPSFTNMPIDQLITFINPYYFGDASQATYEPERPSFWENLGYVGIISLVLSLMAFFLKKNKKEHPALGIFKVLLFISLFFILGIPKGLFNLVWSLIPGLTLTREPARFLLITDFSLAILAAFTLERIIQKKSEETKLIVIFLVLATVFDLFWNFYFYNGKISANLWSQIPKSVEYLRKDKNYFRITEFHRGLTYQATYKHSQGWRGDNRLFLATREIFIPTLNSLFGINSIHFQYDYAGSFALGRKTLLSMLTRDDLIATPYASKILGLQNVKYVLSFDPLPKEATKSGSFKKVFEASIFADFPPINIWENRDFLSRAYLVREKKVLSEADILNYMVSDDFDPKKEVILEEDASLPSPNIKSESQDSVEIIEDEEKKVSFLVKASSPSYLVLTDSYYPGWQATLDSRETKILKANYAFRAIAVPAGEHLVEFNYQPLSFYLGAIISLIALIGLVVFFLIDTFRKSILKLLRFSG